MTVARTSAAGEPPGLAERWGSRERARHYARGRFRSWRRAERDPAQVARILARAWRGSPGARVLDVPCGTGRLFEAIARSAKASPIGVDVSAGMLAEAREREPRARLVRASAWQLPFADRSFDVVIACRLLHHVGEEEALARVLGELVRVTDRLLVASFFDSASWHALRAERRLRRRDTRDPRSSISRSDMVRAVEAAGACVVGFHHGLRFVTRQSFFVAERPA